MGKGMGKFLSVDVVVGHDEEEAGDGEGAEDFPVHGDDLVDAEAGDGCAHEGDGDEEEAEHFEDVEEEVGDGGEGGGLPVENGGEVPRKEQGDDEAHDGDGFDGEGEVEQGAAVAGWQSGAASGRLSGAGLEQATGLDRRQAERSSGQRRCPWQRASRGRGRGFRLADWRTR